MSDVRINQPATSPDAEVLRGKSSLRATMRARRGTVTEARAESAGRAIAATTTEHLQLALPSLSGRVITLFSSLPGEVTTRPLDRALRAAGARVAYPRVAGPRRLTMHLAAPEALAPGTMAILEPADTAPIIDDADVAAVIAPGLAFDSSGHRLGFGAGYYDAFLARTPGALRYGVALAEQLVDAVPTAAHDVAVDFVVLHSSSAQPIDAADARDAPARLIATGARPLPPPDRRLVDDSAASDPRPPGHSNAERTNQ